VQVENRTAFDQKLAKLEELSNALVRERLNLAKTIEKLEPDPTKGLGLAVVAALMALSLFALVQLLVPLVPGVVGWVGSLF